jgi:hypothetical protein
MGVGLAKELAAQARKFGKTFAKGETSLGQRLYPAISMMHD